MLQSRKSKNWKYGCVLDAGSSGTRIYIYRWRNHSFQREHATLEELDSLPFISTKKSWTKKIRPGISTFSKNVETVGPEHLEGLFVHAREIIPEDLIPETPLFLLATAGVRLLPTWERKNLLTEVCNYTIQKTKFLLPDCSLHIQAITGETEGLYGWIAANYLIGSFDSTQKHNHGKGHHTYGFLDMGGASAQIAFVPNKTEAIKHTDDLKLLRMRTLGGDNVEYKVFVTTWLGFGVHEARSRYLKGLLEASGGQGILELPDPCLHQQLTVTMSGQEVDSTLEETSKKVLPATDKVPYLVGTGKFDECQRQVHPLLANNNIPCKGIACLLDGRHFPQADFDINHFVGVSEYWHTTHEVFELDHDVKAHDIATYSKRVREYCSTAWPDVRAKISQHKGKKIDLEKAISICFRASWMMSVLHDGIGIPRAPLDAPGPEHNATEDLIGGAKEKGYLEAFQAVDDIHNVEVSWTLGKIVLYATSVIPARNTGSTPEDILPVGFGSNIIESGSALPADFEYAGGEQKIPVAKNPTSTKSPVGPPDPVSGVPIPLGTQVGGGSDSEEWHDAFWSDHSSSRRVPGIVLFFLIFSFAAYLLLGREGRSRLARRLHFKLPFVSKNRRRLPGPGGGAMYERLGEDLELGGFTSQSVVTNIVDMGEDDTAIASNNSEGSDRQNPLRRGASTGNINGLSLSSNSAAAPRMGSRISSREHLAAISRSRDVSPSRINAGRRMKSPMTRSE